MRWLFSARPRISNPCCMETADPDRKPRDLRIGIVGPCTAGKSTLIQRLSRLGIQARHIAQEHSYVPAMWQKITDPDILIFLDVSYPVSMERRKFNWNLDEYEEQQRRLAHAREHAQFYLLTDPFTAEEVEQHVLTFLARYNVHPPRPSSGQ